MKTKAHNLIHAVIILLPVFAFADEELPYCDDLDAGSMDEVICPCPDFADETDIGFRCAYRVGDDIPADELEYLYRKTASRAE